MNLGVSNFIHGSFSDNLTAVHLSFSNFVYGSLSENLTAMNLGFPNILHGCRASRHGDLKKLHFKK